MYENSDNYVLQSYSSVFNYQIKESILIMAAMKNKDETNITNADQAPYMAGLWKKTRKRPRMPIMSLLLMVMLYASLCAPAKAEQEMTSWLGLNDWLRRDLGPPAPYDPSVADATYGFTLDDCCDTTDNDPRRAAFECAFKCCKEIYLNNGWNFAAENYRLCSCHAIKEKWYNTNLAKFYYEDVSQCPNHDDKYIQTDCGWLHQEEPFNGNNEYNGEQWDYQVCDQIIQVMRTQYDNPENYRSFSYLKSDNNVSSKYPWVTGDYYSTTSLKMTDIELSANALQIDNIPLQENTAAFNWCRWGIDPCKYNYDGDGERYANVVQCNGDQLGTKLCDGLDLCSTLIANALIRAPAGEITNMEVKICDQAKSYSYLYKSNMGKEITPIWEDCYYFHEALGEGTLVSSYNINLQAGQSFNMENMWYLNLDEVYICRNGINQDCEMPWISFRLSKQFLAFWSDQDLHKCLTYNENLMEERLSKFDSQDNPCLGYHDTARALCAFCKAGSARIFISYVNNGITTHATVCGSIRTKDRDSDGSYAYFNPGAANQDEISNQKFDCVISPYYESADAAFYSKVKDLAFHPRQYKNITDTVTEWLCVETKTFVDAKKCKHTGVAPSAAQIAALTATDDLTQKITIEETVGCGVCNDDQRPLVKFDKALGLYYQECKNKNDFDLTKDDVPCVKLGYVQVWQGYIASEQSLVCKACNLLIPNCQVCSSFQRCDMCQPGYLETAIIDDTGIERLVCLKAFCGLDGAGATCTAIKTDSTIKNCRRTQRVQYTQKTTLESCEQCNPGYYAFSYAFKKLTSGTLVFIKNCQKQEGGELKKDFFIRPYDSEFFSKKHEDNMYNKQLLELSGAGERLDNPFYFLQQAFSILADFEQPSIAAQAAATARAVAGQPEDLNQHVKSRYQQYNNITVNIWLMKGQHHFVQCGEHLEYKYAEVKFADDPWKDFKQSKTVKDFATLCKDDKTFFPLRRNNLQLLDDNQKYYIRALDCNLRKKGQYFEEIKEWGPQSDFDSYCIDLDKGDAKPQVRIHGDAYFNITNFAQFENIEFVGVDNLIEVIEEKEHKKAMLEDLFKHVPFPLCDFESEATSNLETPKLIQLQGDTVSPYRCRVNHFNATTDYVTNKTDTECDQLLPTTIQGPRGCKGAPAHDKFFKKSPYDYINNKVTELYTDYKYPDRHHLLFNLYAFDSIRSNRTHAPTLNLINCDFKYFLDDMQALINVETNNFIEMAVKAEGDSNPILDLDGVADQFMLLVGEDRGARIEIKNSTFKHSHFCKGLISYRKMQEIDFAVEPKFFKLTKQATRDPVYAFNDTRAESFIRIQDSTFENLAYQQNLPTLTNIAKTNVTCGIGTETFFKCLFVAYDGRGFVLNAKDFPGAIQVDNSVIQQNMAYVKDFFIDQNSLGTNFLKPSQISFSPWEKSSGQLNFKMCDLLTFEAAYLTQMLTDPRGEFDDLEFVANYETVSPFLIQLNKGPIIFTNNQFSENIGTLGGAVHIFAPDFETNKGSNATNSQPYVYFKGNKFQRNMAYFAGNALYIVHTVWRTTNFYDYRYMCGAGVHIEDNVFDRNSGNQRHNGGANVHRCLVYDDTYKGFILPKSSSLPLDVRNKTEEDVGNYTVWYDDPLHKYDYLYDLYDTKIKYKVLKYATHITHNTFTNNTAGMKGTAMLSSFINAVEIEDNIFKDNGASTSWSEQDNSPYYKYFSKGNKMLTFSFTPDRTCSATNFIEYLYKCYSDLSFIDLPAIQGVIFLESCQDKYTCFSPSTQNYEKDLIASGLEIPSEYQNFTQNHEVSSQIMSSEIKNNVFDGNAILPVMNPFQTKIQSSDLYIMGGKHSIHHNIFENARNRYGNFIKEFAPNFNDYMPHFYYQNAQGSMNVILYLKPSFVLPSNDGLLADFRANKFLKNKHTQIQALGITYSGSLIYVNSQVELAKFSFRGNIVQENVFLGLKTHLIEVNGGIMEVVGNTIRNNGYMSLNQFTNNTKSMDAFYQNLTGSFPMQPYLMTQSQSNGVFGLIFKQHEIATGKFHYFGGNTFSHIFCDRGCAYNVEGETSQQILFNSNTYESMIGLSFGAVISYNDYKLKMRGNPFIQMFNDEKVSNTIGGAIFVNEFNDGGMTILLNSTFYNNFGEEGGSLRFDRGGILFAQNVSFSNDPGFKTPSIHLQAILEAKEKKEKVLKQNIFSQFLAALKKKSEGDESDTNDTQETRLDIIENMKQSYMGEGSITDLVQKDLLDKQREKTNLNGQVRFSNSAVDVVPYFGNFINFIGVTLREFVVGTGDGNPQQDMIESSYFFDCTFKDLGGVLSSAISVYESRVNLISNRVRGKDERESFDNNTSSEGSTIFSVRSTILMRNITFIHNEGVRGGCIQIVSSELHVADSTFLYNNAELGGVIFAIQEAIMQIVDSEFKGNKAGEGSLIYSMANKISPDVGRQSVFIQLQTVADGSQPSLIIENSVISENWATQDTIHILRSSLIVNNCDMVDNYAHEVTHGFTMVESEVYLYATRISNTASMKRKLHTLQLTSVDTGYFNLYLASELHLSNKTVVQNLTAQKQAVLSAISQSSFYASNDVKFLDNNSVNVEGYTMQFLNTDQVSMNETTFNGNSQININIEAAYLNIANSTFTQGKRNHIKARESEIRLDGIKFHNSTDETAKGHAILCTSCTYLEIYNSVFEELTGLRGSAINIIDQQGFKTKIIGCYFTNNKAMKSSGAIELNEAGSVLIRNNTFERNSVINPAYRFADGGAIKFGCLPIRKGDEDCHVFLQSNIFQKNEAQNKGGAMRYLNKNFTSVYQSQKTGRRVLSDKSDHGQGVDLVDTNVYIDNKAIQSNTIASYPGKFEYIFSQNGNKFESQLGQEPIFAPGQDLVFAIEIYDQEGRLSTDEQDATCSVAFTSRDDLKNAATILNSDSVAINGTITFAQLNIRLSPNISTSMDIIFSNLQLFGNQLANDAMLKPPPVEISARSCIDGEAYGALLECKKCEPGYKLYTSQDEPGSCEPCQIEEQCYGSNSTAPKAEYWRTSATSTNYIKCFNPSACLAGNEANPMGICDEGYSGNLCADCIGRYRRSGAFNCVECSDPEINIFVSSLYFLTLIVAIFMLVKVSMKGSESRAPLSSVYLKIFLNHFQILQVISKIKFGWPNIIQSVLNYQAYITSLPTQIISFDCLMIDYLTGASPEFSFNYLRLLTFSLLPIIVIILSFIFWLIRSCLSRTMTSQQRVDNTIATIATIWFLFYPTVVANLASSINCTEIEGKWYLYDDLEEICWGGQHLMIVFSVSIPGLLLWAFGIPLLGLYLVRRARLQLAQLQFHSDPVIYNTMRDRNKLRLGFLTQGYEDQYYYWEIVLLLRKTVLVLLLTFLAPISAGVQSLSAILLLIAFLVVQRRWKPFYDSRLNELEATTLIVQICIIYFGLFYQAGKNDSFVTTDSVKYGILVLLLVASGQFLFMFFFRMRLEWQKSAVDKSACCFWLLSCGRIKDKEAFKKQHMVGQSDNTGVPLKVEEADQLAVFDDDTDKSSAGKDIVDPADVKVDEKSDRGSISDSIQGDKAADESEERDQEVDKTMNSMFRNFMADDTRLDKNSNNVVNSQFQKIEYRTTPYNDGNLHIRRAQDEKSKFNAKMDLKRSSNKKGILKKGKKKKGSVRFASAEKNALSPDEDANESSQNSISSSENKDDTAMAFDIETKAVMEVPSKPVNLMNSFRNSSGSSMSDSNDMPDLPVPIVKKNNGSTQKKKAVPDKRSSRKKRFELS